MTPNELAVAHLWIVPKAAQTHMNYQRLHHESREDTLARAKVYLVEAAHRYQPGPVKFSTYAYLSIQSRLYRKLSAERTPKIEFNSEHPALDTHPVDEPPASSAESHSVVAHFKAHLLERFSERDTEIYMRALMGTETYATMGAHYGLTRARIEQIIRRISDRLKKTEYAKAVPFVTRRFQRNR